MTKQTSNSDGFWSVSLGVLLGVFASRALAL